MEIRLFAVALFACGGSQAVPTQSQALSVERLFPLATGNAWAYDVRDLSQSGALDDTALHVVRVESVRGERIELYMNGTSVTYERRPDGLYDVGNGVFVLRAPLEVGATWPARSGRSARIVDLASTVETPAGRFEACVHVEEVSADEPTRIDNFFCPDVGLTVARSAMRSELTQAEVVIEARLRTLPLLAE